MFKIVSFLPATLIAILASLTLSRALLTEHLDPNQEARCLSCIKNTNSILNIDTSKRCEGYFCGPYQLSYTYWAEAGKPGNNQGNRDYEKCARDKTCAEQTVRAYFKKFKRDCNNDGTIDCKDMAALHKGGPTSCGSDWFYKSRYWLAFNKTQCMMSPEESSADSLKQLNLNEQGQQTRQMKNQSLTPECLDCICDAISGCNTGINNCGSGTVCGPFAISQAYWKDGRRPGASWTACSRTKECSSVTVKNYMEKYKHDCNGDGFITCEDYAAIHRRGPQSCSNRDLFKDHYWNKFLACRANQKPLKDVNMVKVNESPEDLMIATSRPNPADPPPSISTISSSSPSPTTPAAITTTTASTTSSPPTARHQYQQPSTNSHVGSFRPKLDAYTPTATMTTISHSSQTTQTQEPVINSIGNNRYDPSAPTYELKSMVLDVKDGGSSNTSRQSKLPPLNAYGHSQVLTSSTSSHFDTTQKLNYEPIQAPVTKSTRRPIEYSVHDYSTVSAQSQDQYLPLTTSQRRSSTYGESSTATRPSTSGFRRSPSSSSDYATPATVIYSTTPRHTVTTAATSLIDETRPYMISTSTTPHATNQEHHEYHHQSHVHQPVYLPAFEVVAQPSPPPVATEQPVVLQPAPSEEVDYPSPEFPYPNQMGELDRANFDKVVTNIVGSPDFTKSHPPLPEILMQGKQSSDQQKQEEQNSQSHKPSHRLDAKYPNLSSKTGGSELSQGHSSTSRGSLSAIGSASSATGSNKTSNSQQQFVANPNTTQKQLQQKQEQDLNLKQDQLFGSDNVNVTSLFDKGLNESSRIASECLECICDASSNCDTSVQCISKQREKNRCGLYMISWNQYQESDISLTSLVPIPAGISEESAEERMYYECTTDRVCAERLIHLYIEKHQKDCNNDGKIDCYDIAALHRVGPDNCNSGKFLSSQYWKDFNICYATERSTSTTSQPIQAPALMRRLY